MLVLSDLPGLENLGSAKSVVRRAPWITGGRFRSKRNPVEAVCRAPFAVGSAGPPLHLEETGVADWVPTLILLGLLGFAAAFLVSYA